MNQYLMGFISATMLTSSFFLFVGAKKRSIDNLTVQKITIVDESGNQVGEIGNKQLSSYFWLKSQRNNSIGFQISAGQKSSGLTVQNSKGKRILDLGVGKNNGGNILLNGKKSTKLIFNSIFFICSNFLINLIIFNKSSLLPDIEPFTPSLAIKIVPLTTLLEINFSSFNFIVFLFFIFLKR